MRDDGRWDGVGFWVGGVCGDGRWVMSCLGRLISPVWRTIVEGVGVVCWGLGFDGVVDGVEVFWW